jgi:cell division protein FtsB
VKRRKVLKQLEDSLSRLADLEDENEQLRANVSDLLNRLNEIASYYRSEAEKFGNEANQYRMVATIGVPASLVVGLAVEVLPG